MTILDTELDPCIAYGFSGGPEFFTRINPMKNGQERRNANWSQPRHRYTAPFNNITPAAYREIKRLFLVCRGMTLGFLFKDPLDFQAVNEPIGVAPSGSTAVQLSKVSTEDGVDFTWIITRPLAAGLVVYQDDGLGTPVAKAGTVDPETGLFTPTTAWTAGRALTWTGEFRIPVRFAADWLPFSYDNLQAVNGSVDICEVFGE